MAALPWICFFSLFFSQVQTYNQLVSRFTNVIGSSTYGPRPASYAVDGNLSQNISFCFHSDFHPTIKEAWLRIDLGRVFSVFSVKLWYRIDKSFGSTYDNKKSRLPGFSIRVSNNTTVPTSRSSCFTSSKDDDMPTIIERDCERTARYVWVYQDTILKGEISPILEICEIQVFGCDTGYYGDHCRQKCDHCMNKANCGIKDGRCDELGCAMSGYQPPLCADKKSKDSNSETLIMYGAITALCISLVVNGCLIKWIFRRDKCKGQDVKQETMSRNVTPQDFLSTQDIYDTLEDNTNYQVLGQLSGSSHYDPLDKA